MSSIVSARENAAAAGSLFQRLLFRREARLLKIVEERLCRRARFVFTLAEEDRAALGVASDDRSAVLPLVTGARAPARKARARSTATRRLIGTWTWQPNRIGLDWFLGKVVPHLRPDFRIRIAGQHAVRRHLDASRRRVRRPRARMPGLSCAARPSSR